MNPRRLIPILSLLGMLVAISCSHTEKAVQKREKPEKNDRVIGEQDRKQPLDKKKRVASLIEKKRYSKALKIVRADVANGKKEITYRQEYIAAINGLIREGKEKLKEEEYEQSGNIFSTVKKMYPKSKSIKKNISEDRDRIAKYITVSSEKMMEVGLSEYRNGNLGYAIKMWKKILKFNPAYIEARIAIDTATIQMKNLKTLEGGKK